MLGSIHAPPVLMHRRVKKNTKYYGSRPVVGMSWHLTFDLTLFFYPHASTELDINALKMHLGHKPLCYLLKTVIIGGCLTKEFDVSSLK